MNQLINSLCRSDGAATFTGIQVGSGESLADTAAQSGVMDIRLGKVEMPSRVGGVNGTVKYTVVDSPGVPPLQCLCSYMLVP